VARVLDSPLKEASYGPSATVLSIGKISFTLPCSSSINSLHEDLAIDRDGYLCTEKFQLYSVEQIRQGLKYNENSKGLITARNKTYTTVTPTVATH